MYDSHMCFMYMSGHKCGWQVCIQICYAFRFLVDVLAFQLRILSSEMLSECQCNSHDMNELVPVLVATTECVLLSLMGTMETGMQNVVDFTVINSNVIKFNMF